MASSGRATQGVLKVFIWLKYRAAHLQVQMLVPHNLPLMFLDTLSFKKSLYDLFWSFNV